MKSPLIICMTILGLFLYKESYCQAQLEVEIIEIRSEKGHVLMSLYDSPEQFPRNPRKELGGIKVSKRNIKNNSLSHTITDLKPGIYALSFLDDENSSGDMDFTRLGIPTEGFGFSNNVKPLLKAPAYNRCIFEVKEGENKIKLKVQYIK